MTIERVGIVGGGLMGSGIAEAVARSGRPVVLRDVDATAIGGVEKRISRSLDGAVAGGKVQKDEAEAIRGRISLTTEMADLADVDLVVEAVPENAELKSRILAFVGEVVDEGATIASNTSSIPIAQLAAHVRRPERVIGLHFFSPVPIMKLVEVVSALDSDEEVIAEAVEFVEALGKIPIETKDRSGFIVNMLLVPFLMAAVRMYDEGFADAESIDEAMKLGAGHPMGPLALSDLIGLDVLFAIGNSLYDEFKRDEYAPPPLLKRMVASGRIGRKSGRGFYEYRSARRPDDPREEKRA
jgi:3-hydroxybutyryl-CoA dehydrogenase